MLRVGLTGGIATGKSTVGKMFAELGCRLVDADAVVHGFFNPGHPVNREVVEAFGPQVRSADGSIDRAVLGETVFNNPDARRRLNAIVHPAVIQYQKDWMDELEKRDPNAIGIADAALTIESGSYKNYDKIIVVACSPEAQKRRLKERSALTDEQIEARIASQMPMEDKVRYADFVIENSGSLEDTRRQVESVFGALQPNSRNAP